MKTGPKETKQPREMKHQRTPQAILRGTEDGRIRPTGRAVSYWSGDPRCRI